MTSATDDITAGATALGIELGSTRIKAVLIDSTLRPVATGSHEWAAELTDGYWSYPLASVWAGIQSAYQALTDDVQQRHGVRLLTVGSIGISAMMHGYLAFDSNGEQLVGFRTWQNTNTTEAAQLLSRELEFNIPLRWSVAHIHQAVLSNEPHVGSVAFLTTLAGYVHWQLTGQRVLGVGDASGMFPIDAATGNYDQTRLDIFDRLLDDHPQPWRLRDLLPTPLPAGQPAGELIEHGARLLDPSGTLPAGIPLAPPEGDAGTGMVATNSVAPRTANVSVGTSVFAMAVLDRELPGVHPEIDLVTTPDGAPVAMVHCNNGASDLALWVRLMGEAARLLDAQFSVDELYERLYRSALDAAPDASGVLAYNFLAGEPVVGVEQGGPVLTRRSGAEFTISNFMRAHFYSIFAALRVGMEVLTDAGIGVDAVVGHGGLFRTEGVAQRFMAAALNTPVTVSATASEGGAWGMALLAAFAHRDADDLASWLAEHVFSNLDAGVAIPQPEDVAGFNAYLETYRKGLEIARATSLLHRDGR